MFAMAGPSCLQAATSFERQWRFTVLLDGKPVGHHHVDLRGSDRDVEYRSETRLNVKVLFLTVFRYLHTDTESWRDDCLTSIESNTDNNGKAEFVRGSRAAAAFVLTTNRDDNQLMAPCVMSFAYWNPRILSATQLLNAQNGEYVAVKVTALGPDQVRVNGSQMAAEHYAISGEKLNIELWYSTEGRWVGLATTTEGGGRLQYVLQ
jgi:hypothetical protein